MVEITDERVESPEPWAAKIVRRYENDVPVVKRRLRDGDDLILIAEIKRLRAALAAASALTAGEREPVAWRARHSVQENWYLHTSPVGWWECQPLYTTPPASELEALRKERDDTNDRLSVALETVEAYSGVISEKVRRAESAEAQRDEALKVLDLVTDYLAVHHFSSERDRVTEMVLTARRVREGGQADG